MKFTKKKKDVRILVRLPHELAASFDVARLADYRRDAAPFSAQPSRNDSLISVLADYVSTVESVLASATVKSMAAAAVKRG